MSKPKGEVTEKTVAEMIEEYHPLKLKVAQLQKQVTGLKEYVKHKSECITNATGKEMYCDCGLMQVFVLRQEQALSGESK